MDDSTINIADLIIPRDDQGTRLIIDMCKQVKDYLFDTVFSRHPSASPSPVQHVTNTPSNGVSEHPTVTASPSESFSFHPSVTGLEQPTLHMSASPSSLASSGPSALTSSPPSSDPSMESVTFLVIFALEYTIDCINDVVNRYMVNTVNDSLSCGMDELCGYDITVSVQVLVVGMYFYCLLICCLYLLYGI